MGKPIQKLTAGKVQVTVWEGEYQGKKTYQFSVQKSYLKDNEWQNSEYLNPTDLRDLMTILIKILSGQVNSRKIEQKHEVEPEQQEEPDLPF